MEKILVTGANGQLGNELKLLAKNYPTYQFYFTDKEDLDISNKETLAEFIEKHKIETVINAAAFTNVEEAEIEAELAGTINRKGVKNLAKLALNYHFKLVHISTDYVFDGASTKAYLETDTVNPINVYGITKLKGEKALLKANPSKSIIIRTSWLYSEFGSNFVKTMLRLLREKELINVVNDQVGAPTYARDLADTILKIIPQLNNENVEVYHYANSGKCSWFEFATKIKSLTKSTCKIKPVTSEAFKTKAKRPEFSLLNTEKIQHTFGIEIPAWENSLQKCLSKLNNENYE